jgi:putative aldouronate transport system substrate-binding protein
MIRTNMKLSFLVVMAFAMLATACSNNSGNNPANQPATNAGKPEATDGQTQTDADTAGFQLGSEPLTFSFYSNYDFWPLLPWGADPSSAWIKENKQVTVEEISSGGAAKEKFSTILASGDIPDVLMIDRGADVEKLREGDVLVPLDDYIKKYPNLVKYAGEELLNLLRSDDGKLYTFPNWYTASPTGNAGYAINSKLYKELGAPKLETFDDLYAYLKLVKETYPDIVPLEVGTKANGVEMMVSGFEEDYLNTFIFEKAVPRDDQLTSIFLDPTFTSGMKYASKLFREKLITQDAFTQTDDQVLEKLKNGKVAVFASYNVMKNAEEAHNFLRSNDPEAGYEMIWPIANTGINREKVFPNTYTTLGWNAVVITKEAKDPERIFAYLDWLTGPEGQAVTTYGPPGRYWDAIDDQGLPVLNEKWSSTPQADKDKDKLGNYNWVGNTSLVDGTKTKIVMELPEEQRSWSTVQQVNVAWKTSANATKYINLSPPANTEEHIAVTALDDIYKQYLAKAMYAKSDADLEAVLQEAHAAAAGQGYEKLLAYKTAKLKENEKKISGQ